MHLICLWADETISAETIRQFSHITMFSDQPDKQPGMAPVLVFIDQNRSL